MKQISIYTNSQEQTEAFAADLARLLPHRTCVLLSGDLGMGKTVFARGFLRAACEDDTLAVTSPTFNLVIPYETAKGPVRHFDLYRIKDSDELEELGLYDVAGTCANLIEWPERMKGADIARLKDFISITFSQGDKGPDSRRIDIDFSRLDIFPRTAFVFAAGLGNRMRPLTDEVPKPLVPVAGTPMLTSILTMLDSCGVDHVVMNTHYKAERINHYIAAREQAGKGPQVTLSYEDPILETGGGMKRALPLLHEDIFFATNGDSLLQDHPWDLPLFTRLALAFDPARMDILLLVYPVTGWSITPVIGDYFMDDHGRLTRAINAKTGHYMFAGTRILHRRVFDGVRDGAFSFLEMMDHAQEKGRLYGLVHKGFWHHLSTPDDVKKVSRFILSGGSPQ